MAHIDGTFSSGYAGKLEMTLHGVFMQDVRRDAGFPGATGGVANVLIRAYCGPSGGPYYYTEPIDRYAPSAKRVVAYPGAGAIWVVKTETIAYIDPTSGLWVYGMYDIEVELVLIKR